jgi:hypothetical protein
MADIQTITLFKLGQRPSTNGHRLKLVIFALKQSFRINMKYFFFYSVALSSLLILSCSPSRKTIVPAVTAVYVPDTLPALPLSEIDLQLKAGARYILAKADSIVPKQFTSDAWPNYSQPSCDFRYKYRFVRSGLTVTCVNNMIGVHLTGSYQLSGGHCLCAMDKPVSPWVSGSCGFGNEPMRRVNINVSSQLSFLPDYHIRTSTKTDRLDAFDKCSVSLFSTDITQQVLDSIRSSLVSFCTSLDETIAGMNFRTMAQPAMEKTYGKTAISKYGYLSINPSAIRIGRLNYAKDTFSISAGITCRPELTSDSVNKIIPVIFPSLQSTENRKGVSLYLNANYDYAFLSKLLNDTLHNRVFDIKGRTIVVKDVTMKSAGNHRVEIRIDFAGSNKGRVYLYGTPVLDTAKQSLTIPDISYTLESGDLILKIAKSLFRNKIRKTLNGNSYLDIAALVKSNLPSLDSALNRKLTASIFSSGKINQLKIIGLLAKKEVMQVQVYANANLTLINDFKAEK